MTFWSVGTDQTGAEFRGLRSCCWSAPCRGERRIEHLNVIGDTTTSGCRSALYATAPPTPAAAPAPASRPDVKIRRRVGLRGLVAGAEPFSASLRSGSSCAAGSVLILAAAYRPADILPRIMAYRLLSLDAFRGLAVALMIVVGQHRRPRHCTRSAAAREWHGLTVAEITFFVVLVAVGVPCPFSSKAESTVRFCAASFSSS